MRRLDRRHGGDRRRGPRQGVERRGRFAAAVTRARLRIQLTQAALAKKLGWHRSAIAQVETGHSSTSLRAFVRLCRALRATPNQLLGKRPK